MREDSIFSKNEISFENLLTLAGKESDNFELRLCELSFIADGILKTAEKLYDGGMTFPEILLALSDELSMPSLEPSEASMPETRGAIGSFLSGLSDFDKVNLCVLLSEKWKRMGKPLSESDFLMRAGGEQTFAYVRNSLSDEAYDVFSQEFDDPRVSYYSSFRDACRAVADGEVGYCILPFEEKGGARMPGIASMISSFDLKIVAVTPVFGFEGNADVKYALVSRGFVIPERQSDDDLYLEIITHRDSSLTLPELLSAARTLGNSVYRIDTVVNDSDGKAAFLIVLRDGGGDFVPLLSYMTLLAGSYTPVGLYKNLE